MVGEHNLPAEVILQYEAALQKVKGLHTDTDSLKETLLNSLPTFTVSLIRQFRSCRPNMSTASSPTIDNTPVDLRNFTCQLIICTNLRNVEHIRITRSAYIYYSQVCVLINPSTVGLVIERATRQHSQLSASSHRLPRRRSNRRV